MFPLRKHVYVHKGWSTSHSLSVVSTAIKTDGSVLETKDLVLFPHPTSIIQGLTSNFPRIDTFMIWIRSMFILF